MPGCDNNNPDPELWKVKKKDCKFKSSLSNSVTQQNPIQKKKLKTKNNQEYRTVQRQIPNTKLTTETKTRKKMV